jgi:hypothetical protein
MENNPIREMIAAFAAGCMDKDNFIQFKDYLLNDGDLPREELGELQNIVSMIPVILDLETPDPLLKDNVAKKLIEMKDEIKTKILEDRKKTFATKMTTTSFTTKLSKLNQTFPLEPDTNQTGGKNYPDTFHSTKKIDVPTEITQSVAQELRKTAMKNDQPQSLFAPGIQQKQENFQSGNGGGNSGLIGWIALFVAIILLGVIGFFTYKSVSSLNKRVDELESKITSLRSELVTSSTFVNTYTSIIEFFNYSDVTVINLTNTTPEEKGSAKLFLAFSEKEGLLQFKNVKPLQPNQGYQLWLVSKNQSYSMGVFASSGNEYLRITDFPYIPKEQIQMFKVTIESNTGSPTPSVQNYLEGVLR